MAFHTACSKTQVFPKVEFAVRVINEPRDGGGIPCRALRMTSGLQVTSHGLHGCMLAWAQGLRALRPYERLPERRCTGALHSMGGAPLAWRVPGTSAVRKRSDRRRAR
jgi:hypothetical protein